MAHTRCVASLLALTLHGAQLVAAADDNVLLQRSKSRATFLASTGCTVDTGEHCESWASQGYCQSSSEHYDYMQSNCCASCASGNTQSSGSSGTAQSAGSTCSGDQEEHCSGWAGQGLCSPSSEHYQYMLENCCASCSGGSAGSTTNTGSTGGGSTTGSSTGGNTCVAL